MPVTLEIAPDRPRSNPVVAPGILPLESGDHLTQDEFNRRWEAMPSLKKAELIGGVVQMQAAVRHSWHGKPHSFIVTLLSTYYAATPGTDVGDNASVLIDDDNEPQPDACLMFDGNCGGQVVIDADGYLNGAPEFVAEIASSSSSYDLFEKSDLYLRSGVKEYVVWKVLEKKFVFRRADNGAFTEVAPGDDGVFRSEVFPGLWLDVRRLVQGDLAGALQTLQGGLASQEHQLFIEELDRRLADNRRSGDSASDSPVTE